MPPPPPPELISFTVSSKTHFEQENEFKTREERVPKPSQAPKREAGGEKKKDKDA